MKRKSGTKHASAKKNSFVLRKRKGKHSFSPASSELFFTLDAGYDGGADEQDFMAPEAL